MPGRVAAQDHAALHAVIPRRRRRTAPKPPKPTSIIAQVPGSGTPPIVGRCAPVAS